MASNRLPIAQISGKQASESYTCSEKYEWHNLPFNESEQATKGQLHHCATIRMARYTASHGHGHSSEICGPGNGVDGPGHLSSSYAGCHGQDHACLNHSSKRARCSISPGPSPKNPYRSKRSPPFGHVQRYAKGPYRHTCKEASCRKNFSVNQVTCCRKRQYREDRYPTKNEFLNCLFSENDAARHRSYMRSFYAYNQQGNHCREDPMSNISDRTSHGQSCQRDEVVRDHCKRPIQKFRVIHEEQLELSQKGSQKHIYNDSNACTYGVNSSHKVNADNFDGKKARINVAYGQDQQLQVEFEEMRNDIAEGNARRIKPEGPNGAKGNRNSKNNALTVHASDGSRKWDENSNMQSPKCNNKTIASLDTPKLSEGSKSMDLESDKESSVQGCPKRDTVQHLSEVRRDCLELWRARRLRKNIASEADKFLKADQQHTAERSKLFTGGSVRNGRPAAFASSESDEGNSASESSDQVTSVKSSEGLKKHGEERGNKKLEWDLSFPIIRKCDKSSRNMTGEEALMYTMELQPEANTGEVVLQNEQEKLLCHQLSTDFKAQTRPLDTSKVNHTVVTHPDNGVPQNIFRQGSDDEDFNDNTKGRPRRQNKKEIETSGIELAKKIDNLCYGPSLPNENNFAICPKHEILKVNVSELPNHSSGATTFNGSELDRGGQKRHVRSCESYCRDFKNWLYGSGCNDIQPETLNLNILRKKQEYSALADTEHKMNQKATQEDFHALQTLGVSSYGQIYRHTLDATNSGVHSRDEASSKIPDLNCLPSMVDDEDSVPHEEPIYEVDEGSVQSEELVCQVDEGSVPSKELACEVDECSVPSEELDCQVAIDGSKPQFGTKSPSKSSKEEQFKQAEPTQFVEVCQKGTSESAGRVQISDSNTGPPQLSTAAESSTPIDAFKIALCEFIKNILKPLCEDGLLTREVHRIIVKKAVEKVTGVWGSSAPSTEIAINRVLSDESQNLYNLVQGYLELYVGRGVLKKYA